MINMSSKILGSLPDLTLRSNQVVRSSSLRRFMVTYDGDCLVKPSPIVNFPCHSCHNMVTAIHDHKTASCPHCSKIHHLVWKWTGNLLSVSINSRKR